MRHRAKGIGLADTAATAAGLAFVLASVFFAVTATLFYYVLLWPLKGAARLLARPRLVYLPVAMLSALVIGAAVLWRLNRPTGAPETQVVIYPGSGVLHIARTLHAHGLIRRPFVFLSAAEAYGLGRKLQAGPFALDGRMSTVAILKTLARGAPLARRVTVPEGLARGPVAALVARCTGLDSAAFMYASQDSALCERVRRLGGLSEPPPHLEGYLFPDTYELSWRSDTASLVGRMLDRFEAVFADSLRDEANRQGFSVHQMVTLASIIEKEAKLSRERPWISAVFRTRLELGMPLQADPTVQYALGAYTKRLTEADLTVDSPYNTYVYTGLPPGPIASPGLQSLQAALYPEDVPYLYFVARGDGSHVFSTTLKDHLAAKREVRATRTQ